VDAAKANAAQADARFHAGLGNVVELADAENILTRSELDRAVGIFDVARARARLARATADDGSAEPRP
jgi:outer membrane protein TolC